MAEGCAIQVCIWKILPIKTRFWVNSTQKFLKLLVFKSKNENEKLWF